MLNRTHSLTGLATWATGASAAIVAGQSISPVVVVAGGVISWGASQLPDVDQPDSRPSNLIGRLIPGLPELIQDHCEHRGITHWGTIALAIGIITGSAATLINGSMWWIGLAIGGGLLTHVLGDCLTWSGAPLLQPLVDAPIRLPYGYRFKSGGRTEMIIIYPLCLMWAAISTTVALWLSI